ncbi:unnamed protein product [Absidia cylindrospora]
MSGHLLSFIQSSFTFTTLNMMSTWALKMDFCHVGQHCRLARFNLPLWSMEHLYQSQIHLSQGKIMINPYRYQGTGTICDLHHGDPTTLHPDGEISFTFQQKKYIWDEDKRQFRIILYPSDFHPRVAIYQNTKGLDAVGIKEATETYGTNW